ncbi:MAG: DUF4254 domain-containing protein, partial [Weeksellaceae bacterium]|nr:DUF4254 domain-containing protein [Weeksellaceae bacterium]
MSFTEKAWEIFNRSIDDYHIKNDVNTTIQNPYDKSNLIEYLLYTKNWIDTVQWHLEDIIRDPEIDPNEAIKIKRWIDKSNQERTDMVEYIDSWFLEKHKDVNIQADAKINTESPAWAIDRFSILALKVYHMREEANRPEASEDHRKACQYKLNILLEQHKDISTAIEEINQDIESGRKYRN